MASAWSRTALLRNEILGSLKKAGDVNVKVSQSLKFGVNVMRGPQSHALAVLQNQPNFVGYIKMPMQDLSCPLTYLNKKYYISPSFLSLAEVMGEATRLPSILYVPDMGIEDPNHLDPNMDTYTEKLRDLAYESVLSRTFTVLVNVGTPETQTHLLVLSPHFHKVVFTKTLNNS